MTTKRTTAKRSAKSAKRPRPVPVPKVGKRGGVMKPRAPKGVVPMQEWAGWVVVDSEGNAERETFDRTRFGAIYEFCHGDDRDSLWTDAALETDNVRPVWRNAVAAGYRVARVAVAEDA